MRDGGRFLIGMYGGFDESKFARDWRGGFYGIEACLFGSEDDVGRLAAAARSGGFRIGVHFPLRAGRSKVRDALFLARDGAVRGEAYAYMRQELENIASLGPEYVLFHYPKPVIMDDRVDWSLWRFADPSEHVPESGYPLELLQELTEELFAWLSAKGEAHRFTPILEFDALNRYVYGHDFLERLLQKYSRIRLCLDTGRLHLQQCLDPHFDAERVLETYGRFADSVHLWNVQVQGGEVRMNHYPALPRFDPADGWAPVERYLRIVKERSPGVKIVFEHRSDLVTDEQLESCYAWVRELMK
ncbi:hypothetical protein SD70_20040 [Gordoniibacillus kamchatkensis]|uniref:Sugar phosphate isomerase/epimerase n=1 Tax=Gordoniibacillus kamchatkensis TaxID=1590651 RepID=A0ABR5AEJ5_9BACL|nr:TIM barrel protein [Paenibacillus sp. VKM B-2647]KIL39459.1 hypothetical protein SD70_20040 [Paenibacillus sp. VKM B-2647]